MEGQVHQIYSHRGRRTREQNRPSCLKRASNVIIRALETAFYRIGLYVAQHPVIVILFCLTTCGLCGIGLKTLQQTNEQVDLWVDQNSRIVEEKRWVDRTFPPNTRYVTMILAGEDVLTPAFLGGAIDVYLKANDITVEDKKLGDICLSVETPKGPICYVSSLLELWSYNQTLLNSLTRTQIQDYINTITVSPVFGTKLDVTTMLGGSLKRGVGGRIEAASAIQITWLLRKDDEVLETSKAFELALIDLAKVGQPGVPELYVFASRSFDDEGFGAIDKDLNLLFAGFSLVFIFVVVSMSNFNMVEHRIYTSLAGLGSVGLSLLFAYGLSTAMGVLYGPLQALLPFLLLGIGVDDMFVIVEAWKNLTPEEELLPLTSRVGTVMKRAGVSITVTSITDIVAFAIGATTVIPALSAFCIYAALGILALYVLQSTFFVACLTLDQRRRESNRNACICCYKHRNYTPNPCSQRKVLPVFMEKYYGRFLMKLPVKICVMIIALVLFGVFTWRFILLEQHGDTISYLPRDSYAYSYIKAKERYFPDEGFPSAVYFGEIDYFTNSAEINKLHQDIIESPYTQNGSLISWYQAFQGWLRDSSITTLSEAELYDRMFEYLTGNGIQWMIYVKMNSTERPISIKASYITLRHILQADSTGEIAAMRNMRSICDRAAEALDTTSGVYRVFAYTQPYLFNETNMVLLEELYRNLGLAAVCVLIVTLLLIADIWTSVLVFTCVVFTVVDVAGAIQLWGVTIDTASCILLILCVGIAVDYSAHVGHTFMTLRGSRDERARSTLGTIGPAVFYGGFSTFLAFVLLVNSTSYGFVVFFRVFMTVVVFGLFHGLAFLPVVLSLLGPAPYHSVSVTAPDKEIRYQTRGSKTSLGNGHVITSDQVSHRGYGPNLTRVGNGVGNGYLRTSGNIGYTRKSDIFTIGNLETKRYDSLSNKPYSLSIPRPDYSPPPVSRQHTQRSMFGQSGRFYGKMTESLQGLPGER